MTWMVSLFWGSNWERSIGHVSSFCTPSPLSPLPSLTAEAWESVLLDLAEQRLKLDLPYTPCSKDAYRHFGLSHPLLVQLVEQLPRANRCSNYHFSYHKPSEMTSWRAHVSKGEGLD